MQEKLKNNLGIQHKASAKFKIFDNNAVTFSPTTYCLLICCYYITFLRISRKCITILIYLNKLQNKMDILPYRGNHRHSTNKRFALKKPAELTNNTRRHLENLLRVN